ncbi:MAG: 2-aminobenzoate-CoA ligase, partial [Betaproteobacteria bacterium]|nr:2-aminobenzoate-CoA ligase [Betaproteobacteria bacterium]
LRADAVGNVALADQLKDWVKQRIAPYKYPRSVQFVTHLPRTENAKIQRFKLREWATALPSGVGQTAV